MTADVTIRRQRRKSMAMRVTPAGVEVRIPRDLDPEGETVQSFITQGLAKLDQPLPPAEKHTQADLKDMVAAWAQKLNVSVGRIQVRSMSNKWASMSELGNLTLADDLLMMPTQLVDYVIVHELVHLKIPDHGKGFQVMMGYTLPDWQVRERQLATWMLDGNTCG